LIVYHEEGLTDADLIKSLTKILPARHFFTRVVVPTHTTAVALHKHTIASF
jgi:hypothetical protein